MGSFQNKCKKVGYPQRQIEKNRKTFDLLTDEFTELRELIEQDSCDEQDCERFEQVKHELKLKQNKSKNRKISQ